MGLPELDEFEVKVLALGGSGAMGQAAVETILEGWDVDQVIVADYDIERTKRFVESLDDDRVSARQIDVQDSKALEELMTEVDLVMNTVGPFYRFDEAIVHAAIKCGRDYVDICDDPVPTQRILELDADARKAEVTILLGMGETPGITNLLARHAASQLDEVDFIQTVWGHVGGVLRPASRISRKSGRAAVERRVQAAWEHHFECSSSQAPVFRGGKFVDIIPLEDGEEVTFPNGKGFFRYFGHAEPVTLPRFIGKSIKGACNLLGMEPEELEVTMELAARINAGELSQAQAAVMYAPEVHARKQQRQGVEDLGSRTGGLHASASGKKNGKKVRYGYGCLGEPPGGMAGRQRLARHHSARAHSATGMAVCGTSRRPRAPNVAPDCQAPGRPWGLRPCLIVRARWPGPPGRQPAGPPVPGMAMR